MALELLIAVGSAAVGGAVWGLLGYAKNKPKDDPVPVHLELDKLALPVAIGAVYGVGAYFSNLSVDAFAVGSTAVFITPVVETALKAGYRWVRKLLGKKNK
jgi:hypothetical protein